VAPVLLHLLVSHVRHVVVTDCGKSKNYGVVVTCSVVMLKVNSKLVVTWFRSLKRGSPQTVGPH